MPRALVGAGYFYAFCSVFIGQITILGQPTQFANPSICHVIPVGVSGTFTCY